MSPASSPGAPLVVDASVAIKWVVEEKGSDAALALRGRDLVAPALLRIEVANVLRTLTARDVLTHAMALDLLALLQAAPVTIVDYDDALESRALQLGLELRYPVYDCVYLALAERMARVLVTADTRLRNAVRSTVHAARVVALEAAAT